MNWKLYIPKNWPAEIVHLVNTLSSMSMQIILVNLLKFFSMQIKVDLHYMYVKSLPLEMLPWV